MNKLKKTLGAGAASLAMVLGLALPAAAQTQTADCSGGALSTNICPNVNVDNSRTRTTVVDHCSAIINNNVSQEQAVVAGTEQGNVGVGTGVGAGGAGTGAGTGVLGDGTGAGVGGAGTGTGSNDQSNNATTSATGTQSNTVNFAPDCSTHNNSVTNVTQQLAAASVSSAGQGSGALVAQVNAPAGGVGAGAGGAVTSSATSIFGLVSSLAATTAGVVFRKKMLI